MHVKGYGTASLSHHADIRHRGGICINVRDGGGFVWANGDICDRRGEVNSRIGESDFSRVGECGKVRGGQEDKGDDDEKDDNTEEEGSDGRRH